METEITYKEPGFAQFLKSWRERRRLSQLELSLQAGLSQRHISFLETGRSNPSKLAIAQLSQALEMPAAEVDAMLLSAGFAARSSRQGWNDETKKAIDASIEHVLASHAPYPAVAVDRIWNLQKANLPAQQFFTMMNSMDEANLLRAMMRPGTLRSSIINWPETSRALCRMLELEVARRPSDKEAHQLLVELNAIDGIADLIATPYVQEPKPVLTIRFQLEDTVLEMFSMIATIGMSIDAALDDLRIETLLPANEETKVWFQQHFC